MTKQELIQLAKLALRVSSTAYDTQISWLIDAAALDLQIAGVNMPTDQDALIITAIVTYVQLHFGQPEDYDKLKAAYDEQKAQLKTASPYAEWDKVVSDV